MKIGIGAFLIVISTLINLSLVLFPEYMVVKMLDAKASDLTIGTDISLFRTMFTLCSLLSVFLLKSLRRSTIILASSALMFVGCALFAAFDSNPSMRYLSMFLVSSGGVMFTIFEVTAVDLKGGGAGSVLSARYFVYNASLMVAIYTLPILYSMGKVYALFAVLCVIFINLSFIITFRKEPFSIMKELDEQNQKAFFRIFAF